MVLLRTGEDKELRGKIKSREPKGNYQLKLTIIGIANVGGPPLGGLHGLCPLFIPFPHTHTQYENEKQP